MNPNTATRTVDRQTFTMGVLTITACILLVGWILLAFSPRPALGIGQSDRGGDYVMLTQQLSTSQEGVVIVDAASKRMLIYSFDYNDKQVMLLDGFDLARLRGGREAPGDEADRGEERRRP